MKQFNRMGGFLIALSLISACGLKDEFMSATPVTNEAMEEELSGTTQMANRAVNGKVKSQEQMLSSIKSGLPSIKNKAKASGIKSQACPAGVDQACLDALLLALANTKWIKANATYARGSLNYVKQGLDTLRYVGVAQQPAFNTGFTLTSSSLKQDQVVLATPISSAIGELFLTSPGPRAGIGAFAVLTDGSTISGIAGGFAGADVTGWISGAFYCYVQLVNGSPTGACVPFPVNSGGW